MVKSIELENKSEINEVIKNLLRIQDFSIGELYSYISKNMVFYEQDSGIPQTNICNTIGTNTSFSLVSCSSNQIIVDKNMIRYTFSIKNGAIASVAVSDTAVESAIKKAYTTIISNKNTLLGNIQAITTYEVPLAGHE